MTVNRSRRPGPGPFYSILLPTPGTRTRTGRSRQVAGVRRLLGGEADDRR